MKGGGGGSWTTAPTTAVISPTKSSTPPKITKPKSVTHAKKWPERIVPKHEDTASTETRGPMAISAIPAKNMAVLVFHRLQRCAGLLDRANEDRGSLRLCSETIVRIAATVPRLSEQSCKPQHTTVEELVIEVFRNGILTDPETAPESRKSRS